MTCGRGRRLRTRLCNGTAATNTTGPGEEDEEGEEDEGVVGPGVESEACGLPCGVCRPCRPAALRSGAG